MKTSVSERIKILIDTQVRGNKAAFGRAVGITGQSVADIMEAKGGPSFATLQKISKAYPDLNLNWLISGEGQMLKGQQPEGAGLTSGEATVAESETLLKLAVTEAKLEAAQEENKRLYDLLGKPTSSPDAAGRWQIPLAHVGQRAYAGAC